MSEFSGEAGTIYVSKSKDSDEKPWEVWFEDFCILGTGDSEIEALQDAKRQAESITQLVSNAIVGILTSGTDDAPATSAAGGE